MKLFKVVGKIEEAFPQSWAESWDMCGLLAGDPWAEVDRIMLAIDPVKSVLSEATKKGVDLLITHHPPSLKPPRKIIKEDPISSAFYDAIAGKFALYALHTAWDVSRVSPSFALAEELDLIETEVLAPSDKGKFFKIVVFVPEGHVEKVSKSLFSAGAGVIGNYSECSFSVHGEGTFKPGVETKPFSGRHGELKREKEFRLETIVPKDKADFAISEMISVHPYEEVAYDLYPLENVFGGIGFGSIGALPRPMSFAELARMLKLSLPSSRIEACGDGESRISRVAIVSGSGGDFIDDAKKKEADVLITGEIKHHQVRYAEALGIPVILAGHFATEWIGLPLLKSELEKKIWEHPGEGIIEIANEEHSPLWSI